MTQALCSPAPVYASGQSGWCQKVKEAVMGVLFLHWFSFGFQSPFICSIYQANVLALMQKGLCRVRPSSFCSSRSYRLSREPPGYEMPLDALCEPLKKSFKP